MHDRSAPKLYEDLAGWFHLLTAPSEYAEEAEQFRSLMVEACPEARTVLELGSGGGNNAWHLKKHFELTLTDVSEAMLELSRSINPECEHVAGDMRTLRLERTYDAVFVHDAVDYMLTEDDVRAAMTTVGVHCRPGGVAIVVPDHLVENFVSSTEHGGNDEGERGLRYLMWTWDPDPSDHTYLADFAYLLRQGTEVRVEHDRHLCGLFTRQTWLSALDEAGFDVEVRAAEHDEEAGLEIFVGVKR